MVENDECVICKCNQEKAQIALFGQSGQFKSSEPLVIRPNWFKKVKKAISKKARRFLTKWQREEIIDEVITETRRPYFPPT